MDVSAFAENLSVHLNDTNSTVTSPWRMTMITLITIPLSLITITGNVLVIISFRVNPHLRTVSNYFLLSLASADVILGAVSMNLYTTYILLGRWALGSLACDVWLALDYVASNASVMNLLAISVDRYLSVMRPLTYRATRTPKRAAILIALAWSVSFVLWAPAILFWQYIVGERTVPEGECFIQFLSQPVITFGTAIAAFYLPVSVMVALYWRVYRVTEKRSQQLSGLMASHGQHSGNKKQKPVPSSVHSIEEVKPEASRNQHGSICPTFSWQARILRNKRREKDKTSSTRTSSHPNTDTKHAPQNLEDNDKDIPLVPMDDSESETPNSTKKSCRSSSVDVTVSASSPSGQCRKVKTSSLIKEKKAARTLSAILLAFIVTWMPYNIMVLVSTFCEECVPDGLWQLGYWLCYVNSTVNPVCYALCNKHFRVTFRALLLCKWKEQRKAIRWTPTGNG